MKKKAATEQLTPVHPPQLAQTTLPQCPWPNRWVLFIRVHLEQRAGWPAQDCSQNTQHQTRQKRRTTDAGPRTTAPRKTSIPTATERTPLLGRRPHGRLLLFGGAQLAARACGSWPFREGPVITTAFCLNSGVYLGDGEPISASNPPSRMVSGTEIKPSTVLC